MSNSPPRFDTRIDETTRRRGGGAAAASVTAMNAQVRSSPLVAVGDRLRRARAALVAAFKALPIDLGQGALRERTMGKRIALSAVPTAAPGARALDIGCREGIQGRWLARRGYTVTGIDLEPQCAGALVVDVDDGLPFPDGHFDLVWCSEVLEHLRDPARATAEMRRVVRPGGTLVLTTPNSYFWLQRLASLVGLTPRRCQHPGHRWFFRLRDVRSLFPGATIAGYFPYALIRRRIQRLVGLLSPTFVVVENRA